jgi:hypothetical protein
MLLLGDKHGLHLLSDRLVDKDGVEYLIKDMRVASLKKGGLLRADSLLIDFKSGESREFFLTLTSTPLKERMKRSMIASFTMGSRGVMAVAASDIQAQIAEFVITINNLLDGGNSKQV